MPGSAVRSSHQGVWWLLGGAHLSGRGELAVQPFGHTGTHGIVFEYECHKALLHSRFAKRHAAGNGCCPGCERR